MTTMVIVATATEMWEDGDIYTVVGVDVASAMQALAEATGHKNQEEMVNSNDFSIWHNEQPLAGS